MWWQEAREEGEPEISGDKQTDSEYRVGVGIKIAKDLQGLIVAVGPGSPALAAGIQEGDILESVDGLSVNEFTPADLIRLLRGPAGTKVKIGFLRVPVDHNSDPNVVRRTVVLARSGRNGKTAASEEFVQNQIHARVTIPDKMGPARCRAEEEEEEEEEESIASPRNTQRHVKKTKTCADSARLPHAPPAAQRYDVTTPRARDYQTRMYQARPRVETSKSFAPAHARHIRSRRTDHLASLPTLRL